MAQLADFYPDTNDKNGGGESPVVDEVLNISSTPGEALRLQREKLGLTLEQVHAALRIRTEYLKALEDQHFKLIPSQGYVKAWLRKYAQYLKLDADAVVARFEKENAVFEEAPVAAVDLGKRSIGATGRMSALALALLLIAGGWFGLPAVMREVAPPKKPEPVMVLEAGNPSIAIGGAPVVGGEQALVIRARTDAWLEARGPDGTIYFSRELKPGETYEPSAGPGWTVFARDGGAFEIYYDKRFIGLLGEPGAAVHAYRLEEAVKLAQTEAEAAKAAEALAAAQAVEAAKAKAAANNAAALAPKPKAPAAPVATAPQTDGAAPVAAEQNPDAPKMAPPVMPSGPRGTVAASAPHTAN